MVGGGSEVDEVFESASHSFCELDDTVYGLDGCGSHARVEVGQDSVPMLANGPGQRTERAEATACCPTAPPGKFSLGNLALRAGVNSLQSLPQTHRSTKFGVLTTETFTLFLAFLSQVPSITPQAPQRPFELWSSLTLKLAAHLIECLASQHHDMELVEDDPSLRKVFDRSLDIGWAHIHGDSLDLGRISTVLAQGFGKGSQGLRTAALYHEQQAGVLGVQHSGHVAVSAPSTGLINGNPPHGTPVTLCVCLLDVVHQHSPQAGIVFIQQIGHGIDGHLGA